MSQHRIPKQVRFPFGYVVTVRQVSDQELDKAIEGVDACWDCNERSIWIRRSLPIKRRRYLLAHELGHAWLDWQHQYLDEGVARQ